MYWIVLVIVGLLWSRWYFVGRRLRAIKIELCSQRLMSLHNRLLVEAHVKKSIDPKGDFYRVFSDLISKSADSELWRIDARQAISARPSEVTKVEVAAFFKRMIEIVNTSGEVGRKIANEYVQATAAMIFTVTPMAKLVAILTMHLFSNAWGRMTSRIERALENITMTSDDILVLTGMNQLAESTGDRIHIRPSIFDSRTEAAC